MNLEVFNLFSQGEENAETIYFDGRKKDIIPFGSDNLYPQAVQRLLRNSPVLRGGLVSKINFSLGDGFVFDDNLQKIVDEANTEENLEDIYKKLMQDYQNGGNAYLEIVKKGKAISLFHIDWIKVRKGRNELQGVFIINSNWEKRKKKEDILVSEFPKWTKKPDGLHTIIHIKDYESGFSHYGIPEWIAGMNAGTIAWKTDKWNLSRLDNSLVPSGIFAIGVSTENEAKEITERYKKEMQGADNAGKVMFVAASGLDTKSQFTPLQTTSEGNWISLRESSRQDVITALNWYDVLMGQSKAGQLGNSQELRNVYQLALHNVIIPKQNIFLRLFKKIFANVYGVKGEISVKNENPISIIDKLDFNKVLTKREAYEMLGRTPDESRTDLDDTIE